MQKRAGEAKNQQKRLFFKHFYLSLSQHVKLHVTGLVVKTFIATKVCPMIACLHVLLAGYFHKTKISNNEQKTASFCKVET